MAVYKLSQHPNILHRLREEIITKVGTRRPTYDDIKDLKYLRAFINGKMGLRAFVVMRAEASNQRFCVYIRLCEYIGALHVVRLLTSSRTVRLT